MATKKKAKKLEMPAPKKPKQAAKAAKKKAAPKPKHAEKRQAVKTPARPPPKTFAEKLRAANAATDVYGDEMEDEADDAVETDDEHDADGTSEQE